MNELEIPQLVPDPPLAAAVSQREEQRSAHLGGVRGRGGGCCGCRCPPRCHQGVTPAQRLQSQPMRWVGVGFPLNERLQGKSFSWNRFAEWFPRGMKSFVSVLIGEDNITYPVSEMTGVLRRGCFL